MYKTFINIIDYLAIIVALVSLLIAGSTLFLSVLKKGKPIISIVKNDYRVFSREVNIDKTTGLSISYSGNIGFTVFIRNSGANETAYSKLAWDVGEDCNSFNIVVSDPMTGTGFLAANILKPYEQKISTIDLYVSMKYTEIDQIKKDKIQIQCVYNWLNKDKAKIVRKKFDLTDVMVEEFLKYQA